MRLHDGRQVKMCDIGTTHADSCNAGEFSSLSCCRAHLASLVISTDRFIGTAEIRRLSRNRGRHRKTIGGNVMSQTRLVSAAAVSLIAALGTSQARAQSSGADAEIALLKQQLRLMEQKIDRLQKQTAVNTTAAANAKADAKAAVANANAAIPVKAAVARSGAVLTMPNHRATFCTA